MNIEKLKSGSYRISQMVDGKRYRVTVPYKPSKKEAYQLIQDVITGKDKLKKTFKECAKEYIDARRHVLSPSTIRGYNSIYKCVTDFNDRPIGTITGLDVQKYVDTLTAQGKSPKTIANYHAFISSVLRDFNPQVVLYTKIPRKRKKEAYNPSDEDVKRILDEAEGTEYEVPLRLGCYGLRRSEICALTPDDIEDNTVTINKALVQNEKKEWVVWVTKTESSTRKIKIDDDLSTQIKEKGYVFKGHPNQLYKYISNTQKSLNIPHFPFHFLRHYYASTMHELGVSDADIMESGGWKTDHVMKNVYRYGKKSDDAQQKMIDHLNKLKKSKD